VDFGIAGICSNVCHEIEAGSLDYMAPETVSGKNKAVHPGIDIWAMGCVLFAMLCGCLPFTEASQRKTIERIMAGDFKYPSQIDQTISREAKDLIARMLKIDYNERYTIVDVINHEWINGKKL
jgi:serine/threonine protein kinase